MKTHEGIQVESLFCCNIDLIKDALKKTHGSYNVADDGGKKKQTKTTITDVHLHAVIMWV